MKSLLTGAVIIAVVVGVVMYLRIDGFQGAAGSAIPAPQAANVGVAAGSRPVPAAGSRPVAAVGTIPVAAVGSIPVATAGSR